MGIDRAIHSLADVRRKVEERSADLAAQADAAEGIRQGLEDVSHRQTRPAAQVFNEIRRAYRIPR